MSEAKHHTLIPFLVHAPPFPSAQSLPVYTWVSYYQVQFNLSLTTATVWLFLLLKRQGLLCSLRMVYLTRHPHPTILTAPSTLYCLHIPSTMTCQ